MGRGDSGDTTGSGLSENEILVDRLIGQALDNYNEEEIEFWDIPVAGDQEVLLKVVLANGQVDEWQLEIGKEPVKSHSYPPGA